MTKTDDEILKQKIWNNHKGLKDSEIINHMLQKAISLARADERAEFLEFLNKIRFSESYRYFVLNGFKIMVEEKIAEMKGKKY